MATTTQWVEAARPRTLPAAVAPVLAGTGVAVHADGFVWWKATLALVVALALQVAVNYANDYSDGVRGTDANRVGPLRLVGSGTATPLQVRRAALASFGVAGVAGLVLVATTNWWLLLFGAAAIIAAWYYTGGSKPYGYHALGEVFVFVFFGLVAVSGTTYLQTGRLEPLAVAAAIPVGSLVTAILVVNNVRDIETDRRAGKHTLAVLVGRRASVIQFMLLVGVAYVTPIVLLVAGWTSPAVLLPVVTLPLAARLLQTVRRADDPRQLNPVLRATARLSLVFSILFAVGLALGR